MPITCLWSAAAASLTLLLSTWATEAASLGSFEGNEDIGPPGLNGSVVYERNVKLRTGTAGHSVSESYRVSGGGENMWFTNDSFHFVWRQVSGDFELSSAIEWLNSEGNPHKKACLMIRQSLEPGAACAYVAVHGDGLTSLQFRDSSGAMTREVQSIKGRPTRAAITRYGTTVFMSLGHGDGAPVNSGAYTRIAFQEPVYVGLGVCAHDNGAVETAWFRDVKLEPGGSAPDAKLVLHCTLETISIASKDRRAIYHTTNHIEAPNWTPDGKAFLFNSGGRIYRLPVAGGEPQVIHTGFAVRCNNDHGISPDGTTLVISDQTGGGRSLIYTLPIGGGEPTLITPLGPSYWHGWSPDGAMLAYCAERNGEYDVYTVPARGGDETRLTAAGGLDDGPDYSPDGKHIFFNSDRTGTMQIWRMNDDGSDQQPWTKGELNDWFPHPSPDGKWIVFLSYEKDVKGHPANEPVRLRIMPAAGGEPEELARLFGGQGTINVPSWSPDSKHVAFVSYELLPE